MTFIISSLAVLVVLALVVIAGLTARRAPKETWICRQCKMGFSGEASALAHKAEVHSDIWTRR